MGNPIFGADNRFDVDTVTVSTEDPSFPKANLFDDRPFTLFKTLSDTGHVIRTDTGGPLVEVDYLMILNHNLGTLGASIQFEGSTDGISFTTVFPSFTPADDRIIVRKFPSIGGQREWRMIATVSPAAVAFIGQIQWGRAVQAPFGLEWSGFDPLSERIQGSLNRSQSGQLLGAIRTHGQRSARIKLPLMPNSFVRGSSLGDFADFYDNHARLLRPFLFHWNPGNPGPHEHDGFFCTLDPGSPVGRPLRTPVDTGFHDITLRVTGPAE